MGLFRDTEQLNFIRNIAMMTLVKDPNRKEENKQWLLYKGSREFEFGTTENKSS